MTFAAWNKDQQADIDYERKRFLEQRQAFDRQTEIARNNNKTKEEADRIESQLSQQKALDLAKKRTDNYAKGIVDPLENIKPKTDFDNYKDVQDYDLGNQEKAWALANKFKQSDADQSNVAQKDRLTTQLNNQLKMQQKGFDQTNQLRANDSSRALAAYRME